MFTNVYVNFVYMQWIQWHCLLVYMRCTQTQSEYIKFFGQNLYSIVENVSFVKFQHTVIIKLIWSSVMLLLMEKCVRFTAFSSLYMIHSILFAVCSTQYEVCRYSTKNEVCSMQCQAASHGKVLDPRHYIHCVLMRWSGCTRKKSGNAPSIIKQFNPYHQHRKSIMVCLNFGIIKKRNDNKLFLSMPP